MHRSTCIIQCQRHRSGSRLPASRDHTRKFLTKFRSFVLSVILSPRASCASSIANTTTTTAVTSADFAAAPFLRFFITQLYSMVYFCRSQSIFSRTIMPQFWSYFTATCTRNLHCAWAVWRHCVDEKSVLEVFLEWFLEHALAIHSYIKLHVSNWRSAVIAVFVIGSW